MPGYSAQNPASFLMSVIRHSDISKVDYEAIGKEHGITSHSAYCRLNNLKKELKESGGDSAGSAPTTPRKKRAPTTTTPKSTPAKRKTKEEEDDDEELVNEDRGEESPTKKFKAEKEVKREQSVKVKTEISGRRRRAHVIHNDSEDESDHAY